jgi:hypothetical protein
VWHSDAFLETRASDVKAQCLSTELDLTAKSSIRLKLRGGSAQTIVSLIAQSKNGQQLRQVFKDPLCVLNRGASDMQ